MYKTGLLTILLAFLLAAHAHAGWTPPVRISDEGYSLGPGIAANGNTLHVVYWTWSGTARSYYLRSQDGGIVWEAPYRLGDPLIQGSDSSPIIRNRGDTVLTIWLQNMPGGGQYNLGFRRSTNGGEGWEEVTYILSSNTYELQKHVFSIGESDLFLIFSHLAQQEIAVKFNKSTDLGESWSEPTEVFRTQETGRFDMVARGDTIHFMWIGRFNYDDRWETYYIKSEDSGETWSYNMALSTLDDRGSLWPSISVNDDGDLVACWMDFKYSPYFMTGDIFVRYSYDAGESWTEEDHLTSHHRVHATRILWQGDSLHIAWEDWRGGQTDIYYMHSTDNGLTWEDEHRVEEDPGQSLNPDLAVVDETVHVVWRQDSGLDGPGLYYSRRDEVSEIPTLSEWGMLILALLMLAVGTLAIARRRKTELKVERR